MSLTPERLKELIAEAPRKPLMPERNRTSHGLHLALTIVFGLLTFWAGFAGGFVWMAVWFINAVGNDIANHRERRAFDRAWESYPGRLVDWQLRCRRELGWVPQIPE